MLLTVPHGVGIQLLTLGSGALLEQWVFEDVPLKTPTDTFSLLCFLSTSEKRLPPACWKRTRSPWTKKATTSFWKKGCTRSQTGQGCSKLLPNSLLSFITDVVNNWVWHHWQECTSCPAMIDQPARREEENLRPTIRKRKSKNPNQTKNISHRPRTPPAVTFCPTTQEWAT